MSEDWKNKDIQPYLKGKPANWSDTDNDWVAFKGNEKLEQELASIKKTQSEILERLDKPIDTQVTGSNVEDGLPVKDVSEKVKEITILEREIRTGNAVSQSNSVKLSGLERRAVIVLNVFNGIGDFTGENSGYRVRVIRQTQPNNIIQDELALTDYSREFGSNRKGALITIDPTIGSKENEDRRILDVQSSFFPNFRPMLYIDGEFEEGEGIECELKVFLFY